MKKEWKKPELSVIVRGSSQESVLTACKANNGFGSGGPGDFTGWDGGCLKADQNDTACYGADQS